MKNPLEAIALEYGRFKTPRITARGSDDLARRIIDEAKRQGVYVAEDPQLLGLLARLDVGDEIPPDLYTAVAVILSWVYWLKGMKPGDEKTVSGDTQGGGLRRRCNHVADVGDRHDPADHRPRPCWWGRRLASCPTHREWRRACG